MSVDPTMPITEPEELPSADQDLDPDALDDEDEREKDERPEDWKDPEGQRPEDWNEPAAPAADQPTPLSDNLR
ncbi:hypothetical protein [Pseudomonas sp. LP_7_YM]|uniref:hypothetical protein n=1 Tax=Pseudomonas sp. LP_7_YM TaxID=2485137 RepID=UPI00105B44C5|nr:hypothetical protein [Pseudomonas sp. LP_7_YM]TDV72402.1 hypothetical protein EC915_101548 [Pseudomonas sp. LP_7_YM]